MQSASRALIAVVYLSIVGNTETFTTMVFVQCYGKLFPVTEIIYDYVTEVYIVM